MTFSHIPVLAQAVVTGLRLRPGGCYLDATVGGGGHSRLILAQGQETQVVAIDRDPQAIAAAQVTLAAYGDRVHFWRGNFADYFQMLGPAPAMGQFDGIIADLGVSSAQFDTPERGFSFRHAAPLDMRMDPSQGLTAADIINTYDERALADLFFTYGEERFSRWIARRIVAQRPFDSTTDLANTIAACFPAARSRSQSVPFGKSRGKTIHPATRVFQALRIAVNQELKALETFLAQAPLWLTPGGRIGIISFHSLEDRLVKHRLRASEILTVVTKKPIVPDPEEMVANPRARSAKLRLAERSVAE
ncbi:16S rRNA (cytosine(1402)-N(4))-methyltransferase RsmH [Trichothermofontia sp.]